MYRDARFFRQITEIISTVRPSMVALRFHSSANGSVSSAIVSVHPPDISFGAFHMYLLSYSVSDNFFLICPFLGHALD